MFSKLWLNQFLLFAYNLRYIAYLYSKITIPNKFLSLDIPCSVFVCEANCAIHYWPYLKNSHLWMPLSVHICIPSRMDVTHASVDVKALVHVGDKVLEINGTPIQNISLDKVWLAMQFSFDVIFSEQVYICVVSNGFATTKYWYSWTNIAELKYIPYL